MVTAEPNLEFREEKEATNDSIKYIQGEYFRKLTNPYAYETSMCALPEINRNHNIPPVVTENNSMTYLHSKLDEFPLLSCPRELSQIY